MAKKENSQALATIPNPATLSLTELAQEFEALVNSCEAEIAGANHEPLDVRSVARHALDPHAAASEATLGRRDRLAELFFALKEHAQRLRRHVQQAEAAARHTEALTKRIAFSLESYMLCAGIERIPGLVHRFAIHEQPDQLVVTEESRIPEVYFDKVVTETRTLNKERLMMALEAGAEVLGAYIERNRSRLDIK